MDYLKCIVSNQKKESISMQRVNLLFVIPGPALLYCYISTAALSFLFVPLFFHFLFSAAAVTSFSFLLFFLFVLPDADLSCILCCCSVFMFPWPPHLCIFLLSSSLFVWFGSLPDTGEALTHGLSVSSKALYHGATGLPHLLLYSLQLCDSTVLSSCSLDPLTFVSS